MTVKITEDMKFSPSFDYIDNGIEHGVLSPFETKEVILKKGQQIAEGFKPLSCDIRMLKDVPVKLRDGVTIYTDVYLPVTEDKVPTLIAWSPYGKSAGTAPRYKNLFGMLGMGNQWNSGLTKFEAPDPAYWVEHGYAVCNPDMRGIAHSEGNTTMLGSQEAQDGYDLIEWLAAQSWSNGKTALTGTSYLAFSQWYIAAEMPPHLTCINPTEGLADGYRDLAFIGGIPDENFIERLAVNHVSAKGAQREDLAKEMQAAPLADAPIWEDKVADPSKITIPAFVIASYSNTLHTLGTFRSWRTLGSKEKWLRIHDRQEWPYYYDKANTEELRRFFDYYLLGTENDWLDTPRVRYSVLDFEGGNQTDIPAEAFPPAESNNTKYYMNGKFRALQQKPEQEDLPVKYLAGGLPGRTSFQMTFDEETQFIGYPKAKLFMQAEGYNDMDVFVWVQKLDKFGNVLSEFVVPNHGATLQDFTQEGASALRYKGAWGRLRASMRQLNSKISTDEIPAYTFDKVKKLDDSEIVELDIVLSPVGLSYKAGETLRIVISSKDELGAVMPGTPGCTPDNKGIHVLHTGGEYASYVQLPLMKK
ncbi:CocE/NonD family hydrolase [Dellaglioa algida]|uniref:Hydrolase n=1 Tax=Dellaglioa algida TaxID=105612 RepID=A0A5C6MAR4_9LACO|nr:CocE/NonD family hydrolase [Dellaglioa algida]MDK1716143.1 CocE/NonD family hydrolase [Dellaglioa algida]MDK1719424.1 CocE/NonD family hydrolase [Dellaglioa algida]MDK1721074.1 CocE/NonD family hydrolase [Dellaglioa algida]MDK1722767.1 CocE/NonD family hydrolase [Dellaglioa algida]MDK1724386.1 CocE/NonD family hydrolase [Dellaglioa algida]